MRYTVYLALVAVIAGCQAGGRFESVFSAYRLPSGARLALKQELLIPAGSAHVKLQHGQIAGGVNEYAVNCQFRVRDLGPQRVPPGDFIVRRSGDAQEWAISPYTLRFYKTVTLESASNGERVYLMCQRWADAYRAYSISVAEMQEALGDYFSLENQ